MIDPDASLSRRVWTRCASACPDAPDWCYLLGNEGRRMLCQCPSCGEQFWWDSGFGAGGREHDEPRWHGAR